MMDSRMLKARQDCSELQDSYMVFITQTDIFGHGIPIYTINRHFEEIIGFTAEEYAQAEASLLATV
jgi:hypothetical protein